MARFRCKYTMYIQNLFKPCIVHDIFLCYTFYVLDRSGLTEPEAVEKMQDAILGAYKRYIAEKRPEQPVHWAKILMKVTDLRTISTRHAERVLCIRLDSSGEIPPLFLEMFKEGESNL